MLGWLVQVWRIIRENLTNKFHLKHIVQCFVVIIKNTSLFSHRHLAFAIGKDSLRVHACIHAHKCLHMHSSKNKYLSPSKLKYSERHFNICRYLILLQCFIIKPNIKKNQTTQLQHNQKAPPRLVLVHLSCSGTRLWAFPIVSWPGHGARPNSGLAW